MHNRVRRSELELCGPREGLKSTTRNSRGGHSEQFFVAIPNSGDENGYSGDSERVLRVFRR
eukprot:6018-Alexandrium_andersonii.AAC.1